MADQTVPTKGTKRSASAAALPDEERPAVVRARPQSAGPFRYARDNRVYGIVMETAGVTIWKECSQLVVQYLEDFEGEVVNSYFFGRTRAVDWFDAASGVVYMFDTSLDLRTGRTTALANPDFRYTHPLCQVGQYIWEIREGRNGIYRRCVDATKEDLSTLLLRSNVDCIRGYRAASLFYEPIVDKMVVAVIMKQQCVCFLDSESGAGCAPLFEANTFGSYTDAVSLMGSSLAFVARSGGPLGNNKERSYCLAVYDFKTRQTTRSESFRDTGALCRWEVHAIGTRICAARVWCSRTSEWPDVLLFDDKLQLVREIRHGCGTPFNSSSFVVGDCLYLVCVGVGEQPARVICLA